MTRRLIGMFAACALVSSVMIAVIGTASAQVMPTLTITVTKEITGTPADDQVFDVRVECTQGPEDVDVDPGNTQSITWDADDEEFDPSDASVEFVIETRFEGGTTADIVCTVEETDAADAGSSTIECTDDSGQADCDDPGTVTIGYTDTGEAELLVTNDYPAPTTTTTAPPTTTTAPPPVATRPTFTG